MNLWKLGIWFLGLGVMNVGLVWAAEDLPIKLKANDLRFIEGTSLVEATGSVEVIISGTTIQAQRLLMDSESNMVTAEGQVKIYTDDYGAKADWLVYDPSTEAVKFSNFTTSNRPAGVKGPLFLTAAELTDINKTMRGRHGAVTTCDQTAAHYYALADRVEYYPDGHLVAYNITLYVDRLPVFWLPYYTRETKKKEKKNWVYGHNEVEGDYLKTTWDYPLGTLYVDDMQKKGFGIGTLTDTALLGLGAGSLFLYTLGETDTSLADWVVKLDQTKTLNSKTTLSYNYRYITTYLIPSGRSDQTGFGLRLSHDAPAKWQINLSGLDDRAGGNGRYGVNLSQSYEDFSTSYNSDYNFAKNAPYHLHHTQTLTHNRTLFDNRVNMNVGLTYNNDVASLEAAPDQRFDPKIKFSGREKNFSWTLAGEWYMDLDADGFRGDDNVQHTDKLPELTINPNALNLGLFTLSSSLLYGRYREVSYVPRLGRNRDFTADKYRAALSADQTFALGWGSRLAVNFGLDQTQYSPGDQLYNYRESFKLNTNAGGFFKNDLNFRKGLSDGNSPFLFDTLGSRYHEVTEKMTFYHRDQFSWSWEGGHNWQSHKWLDVMTRLMIRPNRQFNWNLVTGWDIENTRYKDLVNTLKYYPYDFFGLEFNSTSDLNNGNVKSAGAVYDLFLLKSDPNEWHIRVGQNYDAASKEFKVRDIMLVKSLHCWELKYTYNDFRKEFSLTFTLKALPDEPIGLSTGRGFYVEGVEKELNKEMREYKNEGAIRRY